MKKIIFRSYNRRGSAVNRGQDISEQLNAIGYDSEFIAASYDDHNTNKYWSTLQNSIVVFIKSYTYKEIEILKRNNNTVILDIVDSIANEDYSLESICTIPWDGIITPTVQMIASINNTNINTVSIPHHWDKRHLVNIDTVPRDVFNLAYIGSLGHDGGLFYDSYIPELVLVNDWIAQTNTSPSYTCHYSVRPMDSYQFLYKPNTKISTAAAVGSNIIHSYDHAALDLVSNDYPYYTNSNSEDIRNTIEYAKQTFGGPIWQYGLDIMKELKHRTSIETIVNVDYVNYLKGFN
jgi:hypothetical protein